MVLIIKTIQDWLSIWYLNRNLIGLHGFTLCKFIWLQRLQETINVSDQCVLQSSPELKVKRSVHTKSHKIKTEHIFSLNSGI